MNCWKPLRADTPQRSEQSQARRVEKLSDWAISSQASARAVEGSTTSAWSLSETVKRHECGTSQVDEDIVWASGKLEELRLNVQR